MQIDKPKVLNRAAEIVEERGWGKGGQLMGTNNGPVCILGACNVAMGELYSDWDMTGACFEYGPYNALRQVSLYTALADVGCKAEEYYFSTATKDPMPYLWNDRLNPSIGKEIVIAKLREAADNEAKKMAYPFPETVLQYEKRTKDCKQ